jgi:large subunit ribosomal protein L35
MAHKTKPNKSMLKRFKVTKTGKLKRHHSFTSHLMSGRSANKRRKLRRPALVSEGIARNLRRLMGVGGLHPGRAAHEKALREKSGEKGTAAKSE